MERHEGILTLPFPPHERRHTEHAHHDRRDDVPLGPDWLGTAGDREWRENEGERGNHEDDANDVELPEELGEESEAETLEGRGVGCEGTGAGRAVLGDEEHREERDGGDWR